MTAIPRASDRHAAVACVLLVLAALVAGCTATTQRWTKTQHETLDLKPGDLETGGLAFLTPATVTGQEEDRQPLALAFVSAVKEQRQDLRIVGLSQTLSAINRAGLTSDYQRMLLVYRDTGAFDPQTLRAVGEAAGARYLAQLKLPRFSQYARERFGVFGLSVVFTPSANIRIYMQIWDSLEGDIAWEGQNELTTAYETPAETTVPFEEVVRECALELIARLP
jgi:hypothetical protein